MTLGTRKRTLIEAGATASESKDSLSAGKSRSTLKHWNSASRATLRNFIEAQHDYRHRPPRIEITRLVIKLKDPVVALQIMTPVATPAETEPEWLDENDKISCNGIVSGTNGLVRTQPFSGRLALADKQLVLQLDRPLLIDVLIHYRNSSHASNEVEQTGDSLLVMENHEAIGLRIRLFTSGYALTALAVQPASEQPIDLQDSREAAFLEAHGPNAVMIDTGGASIDIGPYIPTPLIARSNHQALELELCCRWKTDAASELETFNTRITPKQSPVPDRVRDSRPPTFIFQSATQFTPKDLSCPLCDSCYDYKIFKRLHLHLKTQHDHFSVDVEDTQLCKVVRLDLAEKRPAKANIHNDIENMNWIAPSHPFDIDKHLVGDEFDWTDDKQVAQSRPGKTRSRNVKSRKANATQVTVPVESLYKRLPPDQVKELQPRKRITHIVPEVFDSKGRPISFFRTNSKRPFSTGEEIENSDDDDVDGSWIRERRRQYLDKLVSTNRKLTPGAARFMADWDTHVDAEEAQGMSGDILKRDGAIRFSRKKLDFHDPEYREAWIAKINRLQKWNIFDQDDHDYCMHMLPRPHPKQDIQPPGGTADKMDSGADLLTKSLTPARTQSAESTKHIANSSARRMSLKPGLHVPAAPVFDVDMV